MSNGGPNGNPVEIPDFEKLAEQLAAGLSKHAGFSAFWTSAFRPLLDLFAAMLGLFLALLVEFGAYVAKLMVQAQEVARPEFTDLTGVALEEIFGRSVIGSGAGAGDPRAAATAIGQGVINALIAQSGGGGGDGLAPSIAPAANFLGTLVEIPVRGGVLDLVIEAISLGQFHAFNELIENVIQSLGFGRLTRQALQPAIHTLIADPANQFFNLQFRPKLLSEGVAVKQFLRGTWDFGDVEQELGKQGYNPTRVEALVNEARKFLPLADADRLVRGGELSEGEFLQDARNQGFTAEDARLLRRAFLFARRDAIVREQVGAYVGLVRGGEITFEEFRTFVDQLELPPEEKAQYVVVGQIIASHPRRRIGLGDLRTLVARNLISLGEFRDHLERLGFSDQDATLIELLEQRTLADRDEAQKERARIAAEKKAAAEKRAADRQAAAAARRAELAATKKVQREFLIAKQQAASDATIARAQLTADAIAARHRQIDQAARDRLLTTLQVAQARETLKVHEQTHAAQLTAETARKTALDQEQVKIDAAAIQARVTADKAAAVTARAKARAALDQQLLDARQADRVASFQLARQNAEDSFTAGEITAGALAKKLRAIDLQEKKAVAAENVTALRNQQAQAAAEATIAAAQINVEALTDKAGLVPEATRAREDTIAAQLADHLQLVSETGAEQTAQLADLAARRQAAADSAAAAREQLDAALEAQRLDLERQIAANRPKPPATG